LHGAVTRHPSGERDPPGEPVASGQLDGVYAGRGYAVVDAFAAPTGRVLIIRAA